MKTKAFTLIETLMAVTLMTVVITAVTGLILSTLMANSRNQHSLQATLLAQEGLEALRFMRDSNWLQNYDWDGGAVLWGDDFEAGATGKSVYVYETDCNTGLSTSPCFGLSANSDDGAILLEDGMEYQRELQLTAVGESSGTPSVDETEVTAIVSWDERGVERSVEISTYLTNWK